MASAPLQGTISTQPKVQRMDVWNSEQVANDFERPQAAP
jgi:hypothetical protein